MSTIPLSCVATEGLNKGQWLPSNILGCLLALVFRGPCYQEKTHFCYFPSRMVETMCSLGNSAPFLSVVQTLGHRAGLPFWLYGRISPFHFPPLSMLLVRATSSPTAELMGVLRHKIPVTVRRIWIKWVIDHFGTTIQTLGTLQSAAKQDLEWALMKPQN